MDVAPEQLNMSKKYPRENAGTLEDPLCQHRLPIFQMPKLRLGPGNDSLSLRPGASPGPAQHPRLWGLTTLLGLSGGGQAETK